VPGTFCILYMNCPLCSSRQTNLLLRKKDSHGDALDYHSCVNCHLTFLDPHQRLVPSEENKRYDLHENIPHDLRYVRFLNRLLTPLLPFLAKGARGLDFGCGPGPTVSHVLGQKGFQVADYDPIYFPNESLLAVQYDFITATEVVEHLRRPMESFHLLDRLLKRESSSLGIMTQMLKPEINFESWWYHAEDTHFCFYRKETFEYIGKQMGWRAYYPVPNVAIFQPI
jgi:hypothetical protein